MSAASQVSSNYVKAGAVCREVRREVESRDWRGRSYLELCDFVEQAVRRRDASPAFPCNLCSNESAAHNTAEVDDRRVVADDALLKVDIGAHVEGYVADTAVTLCYDDDLLDLAESTKNALNEALKNIRPGGKTSDVGRAVESFASKSGYLPISNLSGHSLDQYEVHAGLSIPNVWSPSPSAFGTDRVYAVEPFFTTRDGSGVVVENGTENIFGLVSRKKKLKDRSLEDFLDSVWTKCRTLPFAARWFLDEYEKDKIESSIRGLLKLRLIRSYPELVEAKSRPVAQAEHTVATTSTGLVVLT